MSLVARQQSLYKHRLDLWNVSRTIVGGKPGAETYTLVQSDVPALIEFTPNIDSETAAGRFKEFTMLVLDRIFMEANTPVKDMSLLVNVTILADGSRSNAWGQVHRVEGAPTIQDSLGNRRVNNLFVMAMSVEHPPPDIVTHYGL